MTELSRLKWRCRRGTKEMDLILEQFLEQVYPQLSDDQAVIFEQLLDESDMDIMDWVLGHSIPTETQYQFFINEFRQLTTQ